MRQHRLAEGSAPNSNAPTVFFVAAQHGNEWGAAGVAVGLMRELGATLSNPSHRPMLHDALQRAAIIVVPVANPDGYEYSRTTNRLWRNNRNRTCASGVNLNRNHGATWSVATSTAHTSHNCGGPYIGPTANSEPEVQAIQGLLDGLAFENPGVGVALMDVHTYGDMLVYPSGFKEKSDSDGEQCDFDLANCHNPDHQALRAVFGDTVEQPALFVDPAYASRYRRDQAPNIIYSSSGTLIDEASYSNSRRRMLAVTAELFSVEVGHPIECCDRADDLIHDVVEEQLAALEKILTAAPGLAEDSLTSSAFLPNSIGTFSTGLFIRDNAASEAAATIRPRFLKPAWSAAIQLLTPPTFELLSGQRLVSARARRGAQYEYFQADIGKASGNRLCIPCTVSVIAEHYSSQDVISDCSVCADLCDSGRIYASGWSLKDEPRGGDRDCWWTPTSPTGELRIGGGLTPFFATHCVFSFSYLNPSGNAGLSAGGISVSRELPGGGSELVWDDTATYPHFNPTLRGRQTAFVFEVGSSLPGGRLPVFTISANDISAANTNIMVFDPLISCRIGAVP